MRLLMTAVVAAGVISQSANAYSATTFPAQSDSKPVQVPETLGFVEWVVLKDTGLRLKARLDTGAKTSSLHAVNIKEFERNNENWISFQIPLRDHLNKSGEGETEYRDAILTLERPIYRTVLIKRKGADSQRRHVVKMKFCIAGTTHETQFSLADRHNFVYPVLLGRRFMRDDNILVDSANSFIAPNECEYSPLDTLAKQIL